MYAARTTESPPARLKLPPNSQPTSPHLVLCDDESEPLCRRQRRIAVVGVVRLQRHLDHIVDRLQSRQRLPLLLRHLWCSRGSVGVWAIVWLRVLGGMGHRAGRWQCRQRPQLASDLLLYVNTSVQGVQGSCARCCWVPQLSPCAGLHAWRLMHQAQCWPCLVFERERVVCYGLCIMLYVNLATSIWRSGAACMQRCMPRHANRTHARINPRARRLLRAWWRVTNYPRPPH